MLANRWLAFLGFLLSVNTLSVWGVSTPSTSRFSFLSSPLRPSAVRVLPKYGRFLSQLSSASSAASHSGVSTPTDKKGEEANPSTDALFMQLKKWLVLNGAELDVEGIELRSQSNSAYVPVKNQPPEKYLTAMRPYSRGEVIATIPPHLHFTADVLEDLLAPFTTTSNSSSSNRRMQDSTQDGITAAAAAGGGEEGKFVWVVTENEKFFEGEDETLKDHETRAKRFLISFLQQILFEQFNTINEEEDINMLRSQHMIIPSKKHKGLEERIPLSPAMDIAIRFRQKRRNVLIKAINKIKESLNSKKEEKKP
ncbi:hypothetical protein, conserved [Eimeria maxima]|uniref:Uncharacterized protein n=1 Tax=Eimeria maxima TaxID=5804 RepID=U6M0H3_EIMMA|nr:hypothetical protein, conserved [Eimeria maxima]CDJ56568.1 hypothetical protein, conserved [Eimeria maxima]